MLGLVIETVRVYPGFGAICDLCVIARVELAEIEPAAGHYMAYVNHIKNQACEARQIVLPLFGVLLESEVQKQLQRLG